MVVATVEARISSNRLPGKVMYPLGGKPMLEQIILRLRQCETVNDIVVATTRHSEDDVIEDLCESIGCKCYRGSTNDVSERLMNAVGNASVIVQTTGDCPFIEPELIDYAVTMLFEKNLDYVSNSSCLNPYPIGLEVRAFKVSALKKSIESSADPIDRVHGSYFIARKPNIFVSEVFSAPSGVTFPKIRLTVDEPLDYKLASLIYDSLYTGEHHFGLSEILSLVQRKPNLLAVNDKVKQKSVDQG
jgi:spore coat polysaccharide biosynthesis protein SpsF